MKNQNENAAVSDVTARMREEARILSLLNGQSVGVASVVNKLREFADSIDAAVSKTETTTPGNAEAMREALKLAIEVDDWCCSKTDDPLECCEYSCVYQVEPHGEPGVDCPWKKIRAALSAPPRNCDVGTPKEQAKRFAIHCDKHPKCRGCQCCGVIPFNRCEFVWAQMPYEEGGAK